MIKRYLFGMMLVQPLWAGDAIATSIVAIRSPESVVIAADILLTVRNGNGADTQASVS